MATIQIRNIPEDVHRKYRMRAAAAGMSLQEYLRRELIRDAELMTPAEMVAKAEKRMSKREEHESDISSVVDIIREDRESH
jgi:antitoxin FitA